MKISTDVLAVLSNCTISGNVIIMHSGQLERKMYVAVNKVLEGMGGKWNRGQKGHVFPEDPTDKFEQVLLTGELTPPQKFGYFPTPKDMAQRAAELAGIESGMMILEPSAGRGAIVDQLMEWVTQDNIHCYELLPDNEAILQKMGVKSKCCDFLSVKPQAKYDRVVMNPPFERQQDIDHVIHAMKFLKPGGRLVAIMSSGMSFRENRKTVEFRDLVDHNLGYWETNPEGTFKPSGTLVNTVTVVMQKIAA